MRATREPKRKPWGLIDIGLPQSTKKLTVTVTRGLKVKYNEDKYKLTNYID